METNLREVIAVILKLETASSLTEIEERVRVFGIKKRTLLRALNELIKYNRVRTVGTGASTSYWQKDVREAYQKRHRLVFVHKGDYVAGYLFQSADEFVFCYADEYIMEGLSSIPGLPVQAAPYVSSELLPSFDENLPEGINHEMAKVRLGSADELDMLVALSNNIGDVYFTKSGRSITESSKGRPSFLSKADEILGPNETFPAILDGYTLDMQEEDIFPEGEDLSRLTPAELPGISGFQYKQLVDLDKEAHKIHQDENEGVRDYIFKPYSRLKSDPWSRFYLPHLAINEHMFMTFAKNELGFRVPQSYLLKREGDKEYHYLVKRFDRLGTYRYAKANFSTYLGLRAGNKYATTSERMFKRIAKEIVSEKERLELLRHYFYSMVISHEDMHTKNLSLIVDGKVVLMAPLYDIATTRIYSTTRHYDSHLEIDGRRTKITPRSFGKLVDILNVDKRSFREAAKEITVAFRDRLPEYIERVRMMGELEFWTMKQKKKPGRDTEWVKNRRYDLADVLERYHTERVKELADLGWIDENR